MELVVPTGFKGAVIKLRLSDGSPGQADGSMKGKCWTEGVLRCMAIGLTATLRRLSISPNELPLGPDHCWGQRLENLPRS